MWWLFCSIVLYIAFYFTHVASYSIFGTYDTESELFRQFYSRGSNYDTTVVSIANLVFYSLCNVYGFAYINASNMNCSRKSLFHSSYASYSDFITAVLLTPFTFLAGNIVCLKAPTDLASVTSDLIPEDDCLWWNLAIWGSGYFVGLQYTHFN